MATLVTEPLGNKINYTEWARLIGKTTFEAGGFMALGLTNMNTSSAPQVSRGSRIEVGGNLYKCSDTADETITGTPAMGQNYVYCVPAGSSASFTYRTAAPAWNAVKGGWYSGNDRAVAVLYKKDNEYIGKKILKNNPETQYPDFSQGALGTLYITVTETGIMLIPKGIYRIVVIGGGGSAGSSAGTTDQNRSDMIAGTGGSGSSGEMIDAYIEIKRDTRCYIACGGGGTGPVTPNGDVNGERGRIGGNTDVYLDGRTITAYGGAGGAAGAKWTVTANAPDGESSVVASGGAGVKGNGANTIGAPGVKKYSWINVVDGLKNGTPDPTAGMRGNTGGGINGRNGGGGGTYASINGGDGGLGCGGGAPTLTPMPVGMEMAEKLETVATATLNSGSCLNGPPENISAGVGGLKSTSSGYLRIFRVW